MDKENINILPLLCVYLQFLNFARQRITAITQQLGGPTPMPAGLFRRGFDQYRFQTMLGVLGDIGFTGLQLSNNPFQQGFPPLRIVGAAGAG